MPVTRVKLPDGEVIRLNVGANTTPDEIRAFAKQHVSEEKIIKRLLKRIKKPKDGKPGKSIKGDPGKSIKGDPGKSIKGDPGKSIKGDPGKDGVSIVNVKLNKKKELITTLSNGKKINAGKITEKLANDVFEVFYTNPLKNTTNLGKNVGDMAIYNGNSWEESGLHVYRGQNNYREISSTDSILDTDYTIKTTGSGSFDLTLPTAAGKAGQEFNVKHFGSGTINLEGLDSELIDGLSCTEISAGQAGAYTNRRVQSDGTGWMIL